jgi:VIT1/CCC1 family predicted Fe2+/Mn2+ transporter
VVLNTSCALEPSRDLLDPLERSSEILFGLIMVLTFTGSVRVAEPGEEVHAILWGAVGCNLAWGFVDAAMYLLSAFMTRARALRMLRAVRDAKQPDAAHRVLVAALPEPIADVLTPSEIASLHQRLQAEREPVAVIRLGRRDIQAAIGIFLLVFLSTLPVVIPFVVIHDTKSAFLASNAVAIAMLFLAGWSLGRYAGRPGWRTGTGMVAVGLTLVMTTMVLGG